MKKIIVAFSGSGKTELCKRNPSAVVIDLDTSNFKKKEGWEKFYVDVALAYQKLDYLVLMCWYNENIITQLNIRGADYVLVYPAPHLKQEYIDRYKSRGDSEDFASSLSQNWNDFMADVQKSSAKNKYQLSSQEFLTDYVEKNNLL